MKGTDSETQSNHAVEIKVEIKSKILMTMTTSTAENNRG